MRTLIGLFYALSLTLAVQAQRRPPAVESRLPDPGPNRVEVRFALGEKAVTCTRFSLTGKIDGRVIITGKFASGFQLPSGAEDLSRKDALELD